MEVHGKKATPRYERIIAGAARRADELGHDHIGAEHLFLAILGEKHAIPTQILAEMTDLAAVEERLHALLTSDSYAGREPTGGA